MKNNPGLALVVSLLLFFISPFQIFSSEIPEIIQYRVLSDGSLSGISVSDGFVVSADGGKTWIKRNNGLPLKTVYPFDGNEYRRLTSFYVDPLDNSRIVITDSSEIFISSDNGWNWEEIKTGGAVKKSNYFTAVTLDSSDPERIILGTSFNGIFETRDNGKSWHKISIDLSPLYRGAGFYEEISSLAVDPSESNTIYIGGGFSSGIFIGNFSSNSLIKMEIPEEILSGTLKGFDIKKNQFGIYSDNTFFYSSREAGSWKSTEPFYSKGNDRDNPVDSGRYFSSEKMTGIYVNSFHASGDELERHFTFLKEHNLNSMVVDMKDDEGKITYNSSLQLPLSMGAVRKRIDLPLLLKKAKENNIYVIGRIVVFKDPMLYRYLNGSYAIWDFKKNSPWGNLIKRTDSETGEVSWVQYEHWVDPYSEFVWRYNIAIARELQSLGIDEIQFDYIRFPSDGDLSTAQYRSKRTGMSRIDALESFMRVARETIFIPISIDLYGFNSWYRMGNWIGQNIEMLSDYVDVISPMFYPSHFPSSFLKEMDYLDRAEYIYRVGTERAGLITANRALIRPYVQAFLIGKELNMEYDEYTRYLEVKIEGLEAAGGSGYTMWNNSNRYYMVKDIE